MRRFRDGNDVVWDYDEDRLLGEPGGMGDVFQGWCAATGDAIAVKRIALRFPSVAKARQRERELEIGDRLTVASRSGDDTTNLVLPLGHGFDDGDLLIAMPLADGSLRGALAGGAFTLASGLAILRDLAQGLVQMAAISIVHRDLKPANVLRFGDTWKVADFGLSRTLSEATGTYTLAGWGTDPYVAPELWRNQPATAKSDLYALGVLAFEVFTGRLPFAGPEEDDYRRQHLSETPPAPADLPPQLTRLLLRLLAKAPPDRPQDARAVLEALSGVRRPLAPDQAELVEIANRRHRATEDLRVAAVRAETELAWTEDERRQARADLVSVLEDAFDEIREALPDALLDPGVPMLSVGEVRLRFRTFEPLMLSTADRRQDIVLLCLAEHLPGTTREASVLATLMCRRDAKGRLGWAITDSLDDPATYPEPRVPFGASAVVRLLRAALEDLST
ncbi:serine/threonine-protein kinase [Actinoplanes sp. NPDC051861]|uniref:serine/threonine-protein kinase n=1 Tax=Actinoplanes sp. NPDC051861 TaxID=3155170 RepID=UPI00341560C9